MPFDFACPNWSEMIGAGLTPIADLALDEAAAEQAVAIYNNLRLPDVAGHPRLGEVSAEWPRDIVRAIFGSTDAAGQRQVGEVFCMVPKKNGKTTVAAAVGLIFMLLNRRPNADMLLVGTTQKISEIAFNQAKGIIGADPYLQDRFHIVDNGSTRIINDRTNGARLMIRTFGMDVLTGCKPIFVMLDEVHLLGAISYAADVLRQIRGGLMPFPESLFFMITTQSDHAPAGVFKSELSYARGVRDGVIRDGVRLLPLLFEFTEAVQTGKEQAWLNPKLWHLVTPSLNRPITIARMIEGMKRAEHDGHREVVAWATQHLNVEVGMAIMIDGWSGAKYWQATLQADVTLQTIKDNCDVCTVGVDWGGADDLCSLAVIGRRASDRVWLIWGKSWARPSVLEQRKSIAARLTDFASAGDLHLVQFGEDQARECADICEELWTAGLLPIEGGIGLDAAEAGGLPLLVDELAQRGMTEPLVRGISQGYRLGGAAAALALKLESRQALHADQDILAWAVGNAKQELSGSNYRITKQASGSAKIDPLMAIFDAVELMTNNPQAGNAVQPTPWDLDPEYRMAM